MEPTTTNQMEELDVEAFALANTPDRNKPRACHYIIRVDRERFRVKDECLTGADILQLAGKTSVTHKLFQRFRGGETRAVEPCDNVCFTAPGIERFMTIPCDTTEG